MSFSFKLTENEKCCFVMGFSLPSLSSSCVMFRAFVYVYACVCVCVCVCVCACLLARSHVYVRVCFRTVASLDEIAQAQSQLAESGYSKVELNHWQRIQY